MNDIALSKEALSAYLYDVGALEIARREAVQKQQKPRDILKHNEGVMRNLKKPEVPVYKEPESTSSNISSIIILAAIGGIVGFVGAFLVIAIIQVISEVTFGIITIAEFENDWRICRIVAVIGAVLGFLFGLFANKAVSSSIKEDNEKTNLEYEKELEKYHQALRDFEHAEATFHREFREDLKKYESLEQEITSELQHQYSLGILHPQYQTMEAVLVMHNMLVTGRCDTLKEALNAYEDFVWKQKDARWKDAVLRQLTEICDNQRELICSLDSLNTQTATVASLIEQGLESADEIKLQQEIIAGNTRTMALLQTLDFWHTHVVEH